jgi:hypothetical protein
MRYAVLKISALLSYCGGPLFLSNLLKPRLGIGPAFLITFLPVGLMFIGALSLEDPRGRWSTFAVGVGRQSLYIVMGMHLYALWALLNGVRVAEPYLYYSGIVVGGAWSLVYLRAARRWASSVGASRAPDGRSAEPIEPS